MQTFPNENFLRRMCYRFAEVRGKHHRMFLPPEAANCPDYQQFWSDLAAGTHRSGEFKRLGRDGREVWLQATYNPIRDMDGRVFKVVKYATDVTEQKIQQADFQGQIEAIHKSQDVTVFSLDGKVLDINDRALATLGYSRGDVVGHPHSMLVDRDTASSTAYQRFWQDLRAGRHQSGLFRRQGKDGRELWIQASYNPILDLNGRPFKVVKYATDVSANVALANAYEQAQRLAVLDAATSLPNRAKLTAFMNANLDNAAGTMAAFYLDLDHFGQLNQAHGTLVGDRVLGEVADRLRRLLRAEQMVARVGGDEFVIAAPGMGPDAVERLCQSILEKVAEPIECLDGQTVSITVSVGVAMTPSDGGTPDELLRSADIALASCKRQGRNGRSYHAEEINTRMQEERKLVEDMHHGLSAEHFFLEFQPRFEVATRKMRSVEALVRWSHPERGRISPMQFIPLAEQSGLILPLGDWILQRACRTAARWPGVGVSINLSPVQFSDPNLIQKVSQAIREAGIEPRHVELEVTEGVLVADSRHALEIFGALKAIGVKLAIDDFGTGYSSLSYLRNFPFDVIKIDRSFVRDLDAHHSSRPIVQAILALGRALGLSVTAEGVETQAQFDLLAADGCDEIQGFLLGMPSPAEDIDKMVATSGNKPLVG